MQSILVWINSAPSHRNLSGGLALARQMHAQGRPISVFLAQDAVLAGIRAEDDTPVAQALQLGIPIYALAENLRLRGFAPPALDDRVRIGDYADLLDLLAQHERVIGAL